MLARILDAGGWIEERDDQLRKTTHHLRASVAKYTEAGMEIFEHLL